MTNHQRISKFIKDLKVNDTNLSTHDLIELLKASKRVYDNEIILDALIQSLKSILAKDLKLKQKLTQRECQIVKLIGKGFSNSDMAQYLNLSVSTIETHRKNIRKKLTLKGNDNLFAFALVFQLQEAHLPN
ncbi:LuxR family transcriptional regulator [Winogradskyella sp. DF17]|uniref:LuxR family transcriptional regulator n=1 Tax=Winogradskyella pelagia TaxID=2819984 RepID=A0ABS3T0H8_9FLAO|nr:LuxR C-terminal-related transcriptional regulator [Winogradskyella sp. DF17]MBO3116249.1 LuxR family transcriptional regulator [Winogradskyella sp. DF17]